MQLTRLFGTAAALAVVASAVSLMSVHPARGTDLQDSPTLVNHPAADITDVYAFPAAKTPGDVVLVMNTNPLLSSGSSASFDPSVLYQFKMVHTPSATSTAAGLAGNTAHEDTVIQFSVDQGGTGQHLTMYGPAAPRQTGTLSTVLSTSASKTIGFNQITSLTVPDPINVGKSVPVTVFAGLRSDPEFFDLARFYSLFPDRNYANQAVAAFPAPAPSPASFRGFTAATAHGQTCDTTASVDYFSTGGSDLVTTPSRVPYNVLSIVIEMPTSLLAESGVAGSSGPFVHLWATTSTVSGV